MALRMVGMARGKSGEFIARKGIPKDVREQYTRLYGVRHSGQKSNRQMLVWEAQLRLPAHTSKHEAKTRLAEWSAEVESLPQHRRLGKD
jgi:hypothetical protein